MITRDSLLRAFEEFTQAYEVGRLVAHQLADSLDMMVEDDEITESEALLTLGAVATVIGREMGGWAGEIDRQRHPSKAHR